MRPGIEVDDSDRRHACQLIGTEGDIHHKMVGGGGGVEQVGVDRVMTVLCRVWRGSSVVVRWFMVSMVLVAWVRGIAYRGGGGVIVW